MKSNLKPKLMLIAITVLIATELIIGDSVIAKNCNANNPHGQGGLNCGSAQVTGQVVGTKPGQVGAPSILTANQNSQPKPSAPTPLAPPMRPAEIPAKLAPEPGQPAPPAIPQPAFQPAPTDSKTNIASVINPPAVVQPLSPAVIAPPMRPAEIPAKLAPEPGQPAPPAIPQPPIASAPTVGQTKVVSANPPPQVVPPVITPLVQQPRLVAEPGQPAPPAIPQPPIASAPTVGQTKVASAPTLRPRPMKISPIVIDAQSSSYTSFTPSKENLLLTQDASTAIRNEKMITIVPGRQDPSNDHLTACGCQVGSKQFHPTLWFSVRIGHQILPGLCYCVSYCFSSFLQLLRRRSHVRIVLGRPYKVKKSYKNKLAHLLG